MINAKITAALCAAAFIAGWLGNGWRLNAHIAKLHSEHSMALSHAHEQAARESRRLQNIKDEAIHEAQIQAQKNADAATNARSELSRVRKQLASRPATSGDTCASGGDYAQTLAIVFGECATRLTEMARDADGHANDSATYQNAWPRGK